MPPLAVIKPTLGGVAGFALKRRTSPSGSMAFTFIGADGVFSNVETVWSTAIGTDVSCTPISIIPASESTVPPFPSGSEAVNKNLSIPAKFVDGL